MLSVACGIEHTLVLCNYGVGPIKISSPFMNCFVSFVCINSQPSSRARTQRNPNCLPISNNYYSGIINIMFMSYMD